MGKSWGSSPRWHGILLVVLLSFAALSSYIHLGSFSSPDSAPFASTDSEIVVAIVNSEFQGQEYSKPYPPTNLNVIPGPNYVDISWDPPSHVANIVNYCVYRDDLWDDEGQPYAVVNSDTFSYRDYDVVVGTKYWYSVRSADINGPGYLGDAKWAVPGETVPGAPASIGAQALENASFVWWEWPYDMGGTDVTTYNVYRGTSSTNLSFIATVGGGGVTARHTDTGLVNGVTYYYRVTACNSMGEGPPTATTTVKPNWGPRNVNVSPTSVDNCDPVTITLTWQHPSHNYSEVTRYLIIGTVDPAEVSRENTSFTTTVGGGWGYGFQVVAIYDDGNRVYSPGVSVMAPMCEGVGFCLECFALLIVLIVAVALVVVAIIIVIRRRGRGRS